MKRLDFLDAMRAIAALSVVVQHVFMPYEAFANFTTTYIQLGVFGVTVFFLCSGFIITASVEKYSQPVFWTRRFFRLYPLYFFSLIMAVLLGHPTTTKIFIADIFMVGKLFAEPTIGAYWTLTLELVFYITISILFLAGITRHAIRLTLGILLLAVLYAIFLGKSSGIVFYFSTFFVGTVFYRYYSGQVSIKTAVFVLLAGIAAILLITSNTLLKESSPSSLGTHNFLPVTNAWIGSYVLFFGALFLSRVPSFVAYLGKISYSIYLMQSIIQWVIPEHYIFTRLFLTILVSALTYHYIENPYINLSKTFNVSSFLEPSRLK